MSQMNFTGLVVLCIASMLSLGCGQYEKTAADATAAQTADQHDRGGDHAHDHDGHEHAEHGEQTHGEWWCAEHGVPENECALCDTSLVAVFKANADWCDEHSRPQSQCFKCDPELFKQFAARYAAKYGKQPPKPSE